jgi:hypothetical protein
MEVWEFDLLNVKNISKFKYFLTVIDLFSKSLHVISLKYKTGSFVTSVFQSIFTDKKFSKPHKRRPLILRTYKVKEFLNKAFQEMLKREGIQFQVCKNLDVKCSLAERVQRTLHEKLNKYLSLKTLKIT